MTLSKTPIGDNVRKLEFQLLACQENITSVTTYIELIQSSQCERYQVIHPVLEQSDLWVDKDTYVVLMQAHLKLLEADIVTLEHKLTTIYAVVNDCLAEGDK